MLPNGAWMSTNNTDGFSFVTVLFECQIYSFFSKQVLYCFCFIQPQFFMMSQRAQRLLKILLDPPVARCWSRPMNLQQSISFSGKLQTEG